MPESGSNPIVAWTGTTLRCTSSIGNGKRFCFLITNCISKPAMRFSDMQDRIGMGEVISTSLGMTPPLNSKPEWSNWREKGDSEDVASFYASAPPELLRSLGGFVCKSAGSHDSG